MIGFIIAMIIIGIIAGYLARLLVFGPDPMGFWRTVALGIVGSFIGGLIGGAFAGRLYVGPSSLGLSILGAIIALLIYRKIKYGSLSGPGRTWRRPMR
jgi:uncharacterized membrane protein YeaQ/YmgE (transglycosylase-associated protein family)